MSSQMAELDVFQYGGDYDGRKERYNHLLCTSYSLKHPPIALVGLSEKKVVTTQIFLYWPYRDGNRTYDVYQSGSSLVHPDFRGQGLFQKMLLLGSAIGHQRKADFFIGFPVPVSYGAFIKDGWIDIGNLRWWSKVIRLFKLAKQKLGLESYSPDNYLDNRVVVQDLFQYAKSHTSQFYMANSRDFIEWRYDQNNKKYSYYEYAQGNIKILFVYKLSIEHGFMEIIVGEIYSNTNDSAAFTKALKIFCDKIKKSPDIVTISFAFLTPSPFIFRGLMFNGFVPHKKTAPFLVKDISTMVPKNKNTWDISRGDIDTW